MLVITVKTSKISPKGVMGNPQPNTKIEIKILQNIFTMGIIYRAISPNGKSYVGQTTGTRAKRWQEHDLDSKQPDGGNCRYLNEAIRKYGSENFILETLLECNDDQLNHMERQMIKAYASFGPMGYNLTEGGGANTNFSEESKELMHHAQIAAAAHKFTDWPAVEIPRHMIRWNRDDKGYIYKGYAIHKHPKCSFKVFADPSITILDNYNLAIEFIRELNAGEKEVVKRPKLPDGIQYRRDGIKVGFKAIRPDGMVKTFMSMKKTEEEKLLEAIEWIKNQ